MDLHAGSLLGLSAGYFYPSHLVALRWGLLGVSWAWAALSLRGQTRHSLLGGLAFGAAAVGFWVLALGRPYGLLIDVETTQRAADAAVVSATGDARLGFIAGRGPASGLQVGLAALGLEPPLLLLLPSLLPLVAFIAVALLVATLVPSRERALLAASLWLVFPSTESDLLRGDGFLGAPWRRPDQLFSVAPVVAALLLLSRARRRASWALAAGLSLATAWAAVVARPATPDRGPVGALLALTLDQGPFLLLGAWGLFRGVDAATRLLLAVGSLIVVGSQLPAAHLDPWCGQTLFRLGLLLASCGPIEELELRVGAVAQMFQPLSRFGAARLGRALLLALAVPTSALAWWNPIQLDGRVAERSVEPLSGVMLEAMDWIGRETNPRAVFVASPEYAPAVAAVAGRRVLRAPTLAQPPDDIRRRAQKAAVEGRRDPALDRFGVAYILVGPGDAERWDLTEAGEAERRGLRPVFRGVGGYFLVYALAGS